MNPLGGNAARLRRFNRERIVETLRSRRDASIADLARLTSLSVATCANIAQELVAEGMALELEERASRGGRPARRYAYNPDNALVAAVLLKAAKGREHIRYVVANAAGKVVAGGTESHARIRPEHLYRLLESLRGAHPAIKAAAVSVPGIVTGGVIGICDLPGMTGEAVEEQVRTRLGIEAVSENDMNFAAMGYYHGRSGRPLSSLSFMVFPGDNPGGSGLVVNGMLVRGKTNFAGEVSFIPFGDDREAQARLHGHPEKLKRFIAKIAAAVTAVVNPDVIVLSGDAVREDMLADIRRHCLEAIPAEHLPEMVIVPDYDDHCVAGMIAMAMNRLSERRE